MITTTPQNYIDIEKTFLSSFFDSLNRDGIKYMVLRNYQHLPESLNGSDLDIWVHKDDCQRFRNILTNDILSSNHGTIVARYGKKCERICIIYGQNGIYNGIQIDLHAGCFLHNGKNIADSEGIFFRRAYFNNIPIPSDIDICFISFFKELLNNGSGGKTKDYFKSFVRTMTNDNIQPQEEEYKTIFGSKAWNYLKEISLGKDTPDFFKISKKMRAGLFGSNLFWSIQKALETMKRLPRVIKPVGFDLIISGTDGAGQTTLINEIQPALKNAFHNGFFYYHMFPGLFPTLSQLLKHKSKDSAPVVNPHGGKPSGTLVSLFRMFYYSLDYVIGYWVKIYLCMIKKSSIHVFDRYCYDYLLDPQRAAINLPLMIRRAFVFFYPKPALFIYLTASPQVIFERKPELPIEEITRQQDMMNVLKKRMKNVFLLNSDVSIAETVDHAMDIICKQMSCRIK